MLYGCDESHYQTDLEGGKDFVIIKCSEGLNMVDNTFIDKKNKARANHEAVGFYHFADGNDPIMEANHFLSSVGDILEGEIVALDAETGENADWCKKYLDYLTSQLGFKPLLYAPVGGWNVALDYPLWVARYGRNNGQINYDQLPRIGKWKNYTIWQYSSANNLDLDIFDGGMDEFKKLGKPAGIFNPAPIKPMLIIYGQQDPRWANIKLGQSPCTIGRYGCTTTDLAMAYNWLFGAGMTPPQCEEKLNYTSDGLILWASLKNIRMNLVNRFRTKDDNLIKEALDNPNEICLLEVNHNHWLFLIGRKLPILGYKVIDPWYGDSCYTNRYGNNITGGAIISKI